MKNSEEILKQNLIDISKLLKDLINITEELYNNSDYETKKTFREEYRELMQRVTEYETKNL